MKDVRCIQRECSFRRDRTLLYCNISCESTDGLLLLLLDTLSKHLAADWMNHLSISGLLQSVRSAARGERPTSRTNWWIKLSMKRKNTSASCCSSHTTSNWKPDRIGSRMSSQIQKCNDKPPGFLVNIWLKLCILCQCLIPATNNVFRSARCSQKDTACEENRLLLLWGLK